MGVAWITAQGNVGLVETATENNRPVIRFGLAVNQRKDDPPLWFKCATWNVSEYTQTRLVKGAQVIITGELIVRTDLTSIKLYVNVFSMRILKSPADLQPRPSDSKPITAEELPDVPF